MKRKVLILFSIVFVITNIYGQNNMKLNSSSYQNNGIIPVKFAGLKISGGRNISPCFYWFDFPENTKSFVLTITDKYESQTVNWIVINIPVNINSLEENSSNSVNMPIGAEELINTFGEKGYTGLQPPIGLGQHDFVTTVYSLSVEKINLTGKVSEKELFEKIKPYILDKVSLTGHDVIYYLK